MLFAISNFTSKLLVFILLPLYTSYLSTAEYGTVDLLTNLVNILFPILTLSVIEGILRFSFNSDVKKNDVLVIGLWSVLVSTLLMLCVYPLIAMWKPAVLEYWKYFILLYNSFCFSTTISYYLRGINQTKLVAAHGIIQTAVAVSLNVILLVGFHMGFSGYVISLIASYYTAAVLIILIGKLYTHIETWKINRALLKEILGYSVPIIPSKIAWWINNSADKYFIIAMISIAESGVYSVAHKIPTVISVLSEIFNQAWQLSAIEVYTKKNEGNSFYSTIHQHYILFMIVGASFLIILAQLIGSILFEKEFYTAWKYVPPLVVAAVFSSLSGFYHSIFRAAKKPRVLAVTVISGTAVNIVCNSLLIPRLGALGAAYGTMAGFVVEWCISYLCTIQIIPLSIQPLKLTLVTLILCAESAVMAFDVRMKYVFASLCIVLIIGFTYREISETMKKMTGVIAHKLHRR